MRSRAWQSKNGPQDETGVLFAGAPLSRASHDRADRVDAPVAGGKKGVCLDAAFVVAHLRRGKTKALDGRRTSGSDQNVRTRDWFFMPGGGDENTNAVAARLDPRNPHVLMNDDPVTRERGAAVPRRPTLPRPGARGRRI